MAMRKDMWDRLGDEPVDVLVIGGGINGAGIARDAARRGLKVALVEMKDLAFGTSSRSSKLVHGGLRYLENLEFSLVFESVSERRILMDIAPHLVNPLGFLFPVYKKSRRNLFTVNAGMWLYDGLSLFRSPKLHRKLSRAEVKEEEPVLNASGLKGAPLYYDCSTDDARLTLESALDATNFGAIIATYARVVEFIHDEETGRLRGAVVEDMLSGERSEVLANAVINATGPWTDSTVAMSGAKLERSLLRPTKGVHIVVPRASLPVNNAVVCFHPDDGRVLFAIPWGDATYIGTTDTDFEGDPALVAATREDVEYLISASNAYFPESAISEADVVSTWAGLRPLMRPAGASADVDESAVSREHQVIVGKDGLITVAGGKLTTYRRMSAEVVDSAVKLLRLSSQLTVAVTAANTDREPLPGAVGWPADDDHARVGSQVAEVGEGTLTEAQAKHLADTYGMRAVDLARLVQQDPRLAAPLVEGRNEILAQVTWACREELAASVSDVLIRRTQLFFKDVDQGLGAIEATAAELARVLGWSEEERARSIADYESEVALSRAWRSGPASKVDAEHGQDG